MSNATKSLHIGSAVISECGNYRYSLRRHSNMSNTNGQKLVFVMLNPSTADASLDDNTVKRCISFMELWGYSHLEIVNLFAFRATEPSDMLAAEDPIGPENDTYLYSAIGSSETVICAWGNPGDHKERLDTIKVIFKYHSASQPCCLGVNKSGMPRHPLYLKRSTELKEWTYND